MPGRSWDWHIEEFDAEHAASVEKLYASSDSWTRLMGMCHMTKCKARAECYVCYSRPGGRGTVTHVRKSVCRQHAVEAIAQHGGKVNQ